MIPEKTIKSMEGYLDKLTPDKIKQNNYRMNWMEKNIGDKYLILFGDLCLQGYEIQNVVDGLWELFKPEDNT